MTVRVPKGAFDKDAHYEPALFYNSAREGMKDFLANTLSAEKGILLPAFIGWSAREGSGVYDPVHELGIRAGFYDLAPDLSVDMASLEAELRSGNYRVVVVIHYFGRTEPALASIAELARNHGALLLEDLAHGFFSAQRSSVAGKWGDVRLYSLHKMFPFRDGGMITYARPDLVIGQVETAPHLAGQLFSYNWSKISSTRIDNFCRTMESLRGLPGHGITFRPLWSELADGDVPQTLPVHLRGGVRDAIYHQMNRDGFGMVSLYHTLIEQIGDQFPRLNELSRSIINFPVHQDVAQDEIQPMVQSFGNHLAEHLTGKVDDGKQQ